MTYKENDTMEVGDKTYVYTYTGQTGCEGCPFADHPGCPDCAEGFRWKEKKDDNS